MSASTDRQRMQKKQRKRKKRRLVAFFILLPLVFLAFTAAGYGAFLYNKAETVLTDSYADDGREKSPLRDAEVHPLNDNISILFIGLDESEVREKKDLSRSDALMLVTLNVEEKSIKLLSIPRDSYAYVPAMGYKTKINHAHAYGGPPATIEAVEELMEVPVDYYVRMNFYAFMDVVDALGGNFLGRNTEKPIAVGGLLIDENDHPSLAKVIDGFINTGDGHSST